MWKASGLGEGYAGFAVTAGKVFTQGQNGDQEFVIALDASTGRKAWQVTTGGQFRERRGHGPRGTPTIDGDSLYALAADGSLACLQAANGEKVWGLNLVQAFGGEVPNWGFSESPLIDGDRVIVTPGGQGASVVALHKKTGKVVWKSQSDEAGYSSPILADVDGRKQVIVLTGNGVLGLGSSNGELLWRYDKVSNRTANIATPIFHDGHVFVSTDYGTGCALLKLTGGKAEEVYFNREMRNHYSSSVLVEGHLYGFSSQILTAMEFSTGNVLWKDRAVGKGSVAYADGKLYLLSEDGVAALAEATPAAYREISRFEIPRGEFPTWTPPVIAGGRLYLRGQDNAWCFNVKA